MDEEVQGMHPMMRGVLSRFLAAFDDVAHKPTIRQAECLFCILAYQRAFGFHPSIRLLCLALGVASTNAVSDLIEALSRKGWFRRTAMGKGMLFAPRTWRVLRTLSDMDAMQIFAIYFRRCVDRKDLAFASYPNEVQFLFDHEEG